MKKFLLPAILFSFFKADAQYCTSGGPSSTADSNVQLVQLNGESGTSINFTGCPGVTGVQNLTSLSATVNVNSSYTLVVDFGTCQGNYYGAGEVFIDWNKNFIFETNESIGTWTGTPPVAASSFPFTVPSSAQNGITRMRVIQWENGILPLNPCGSFTWGSVMDFSIQVGGGLDCSGYSGDSFSSPMIVPSLPYIDTNSTVICYSSNSSVYSSPDVYYRFIAPASAANVTISLCNSGFDTYLSLLDASGNLLVFNDDYSACGSSSSITYSASAGDTLYAVVEGWNTQTGEFIININAGFVSVDELTIGKINLYPNPAKNFSRLEGISEADEISISDIRGTLIKTISLNNEDYLDLNLSGFTNGIYFLKIKGKDFIQTKKLLIQLP